MTTASERAAGFFASQSDRVRARFYDAGGQVRDAEYELNLYANGKDRASFLKMKERITRARTNAIEWADGGFSQWTLSLLDRLAPSVAHAFTKRVIPLAEHAIEQWPVKTGESRDGLVLGFKYDERSGEASALFYGAAPYTWYVAYASLTVARFEVRSAVVSGDTLQIARLMARSGRAIGAQTVAQIKAKEGFRERVRKTIASLSISFATGNPEPRQETIDKVAGWYNITPAYAWAIWRDDAMRKAPTIYRLPDGGDARGAHAWTAQVYKPGMKVVDLMAADVVEALEAA